MPSTAAVTEPARMAAKAAILAGSVTAAVLGMIYMSVVCKHPSPKDE